MATYGRGGPLQVIDVSDPTAPAVVGEVAGDFWSSAEISGDYVYVTGGDSLHVIDVSSPSAPEQVAALDTGAGGSTELAGLTLRGSRAYVGALSGGFLVVDISDPTSPTTLGRTDGWYEDAVAVTGDYAYAARMDELEVIDISDPASPTVVANFDAGAVEDVAAADGYAFVADRFRGLAVIKHEASGTAVEGSTEAPLVARLHPVSPNPFSAQATIGYTLHTAEHVSIAIYDMLGRRVAVLLDERQGAGDGQVIFSGSDAQLATGVYVVRLRAGAHVYSQRMVHVR